jgi:propionate CoA-transferase
VFVGTFTSGGLEVRSGNGTLTIVQEGRSQKLVSEVSHLSFNAKYVASLGTKMMYITERAVFELASNGILEVTEIAPGIDLQTQVLALCPEAIAVSPKLRLMDAAVFSSAQHGS